MSCNKEVRLNTILRKYKEVCVALTNQITKLKDRIHMLNAIQTENASSIGYLHKHTKDLELGIEARDKEVKKILQINKRLRNHIEEKDERITELELEIASTPEQPWWKHMDEHEEYVEQLLNAHSEILKDQS